MSLKVEIKDNKPIAQTDKHMNRVTSKDYEQRFLVHNVFTATVPAGFVIMDTKNNPRYPLKDILLDKVKYDSDRILLEYRRVYGATQKEIFMPWHFQVEIVGRNYIIQNTRPFNYKSLFPEYKEQLIICIVGDSKYDVYTPEIYSKIANLCIKPYTHTRTIKAPMKITYLVDEKNFSTKQLERWL